MSKHQKHAMLPNKTEHDDVQMIGAQK